MREQETSVDVEEELRVAVKARQELGKDHEDEVIESFLARVQGTIDARVEARVNEALRDLPEAPRFASPSIGRIAVVLGFITAIFMFTIPMADLAGGLVAIVALVASIGFAGAILILPSRKARPELAPGKGERDKNKLR
ncbi:MAG: hypothetical protein OXI33_01140 [Chloroflexota bacterium]|nr:hypothetical protein [Chloroflexota bacterium]